MNVYIQIGLCSQQNSCELELSGGGFYHSLPLYVCVNESERERGGQAEGMLMIFLISITKKPTPSCLKKKTVSTHPEKSATRSSANLDISFIILNQSRLLNGQKPLCPNKLSMSIL